MPDIEFLAEVKRLAIVAMFSDDEFRNQLVLKGGNALDIVYDLSARSSVDLDFSIDGEFADDEQLRDRIELALSKTFSEAGYVAFDVRVQSVPPMLSEELETFWGGYKVEFKIIRQSKYAELNGDDELIRRYAASVGKRGSTRFRIDLSKHEFCGAKRSVILDNAQIYVYSPEMIVCEKLRAICQQMPEYAQVVKSHPSARARDFIDIHTVANFFDIDFERTAFQQLLKSTFEIKHVPLRLLGRIEHTTDFHQDDYLAVRDTVKPDFELREFDFYFKYVIAKCVALEPLWNEETPL